MAGDGSHGQLGQGTLLQEINTPKLIEQLRNFKIVALSCGESHTAVVSGNLRLSWHPSSQPVKSTKNPCGGVYFYWIEMHSSTMTF